MEITIKAPSLTTARSRVLAIESAAEAICKSMGQDPADGTMILLTAAAHIASRHSDNTSGDIAAVLTVCLADAIEAAARFFPRA
jgi:hypothetical protein